MSSRNETVSSGMRRAGLALASVALLSCGREGTASAPQPAVSSVSVSPSSTTIYEGATLRLVLQAFDAGGNPTATPPITWSSSDDGIATVTSDGMVQGVRDGTVTVAAAAKSAPSITAISLITVRAVPTSTIRVSLPLTVVYAGKTVQISAVAFDSVGRILVNRSIGWTSSDTTKATVSASGLVQTRSYGTVQIYAKADEVRSGVAVTILPGDDFVFPRFIGGLTRIFSMNTDGSGLTDLAPDTAFNFSPSWAPDGRRVVSIGLKAYNYYLRISTLGNPVVESLAQTGASYMVNATWSPKGTEIAYSAGANFQTNVYVVDLATKATRRISTIAGASDPKWSPNGQFISYVAANGFEQLILNDRSGRSEIPITNTRASFFSHCWGDDSHLFYWAGDLYVASISPAGVKSTRLTNFLTMDGASIACSTRGRIALGINGYGNSRTVAYVVNGDGTDLEPLPLPTDGRISATWSTDGKRLFVTVSDSKSIPNSLLVLEEDGRMSTLLTNVPFGGILWNPTH